MPRRFAVAFDDSGGVEQLAKWNGEPIAGDHEIVTLAGVYVDEEQLPEFERQWNEFRADIQRTLGTEELPPVHMRLMWGKKLPREYRGKQNPYLAASFSDVKGWVRVGWDLIDQYVRQRLAGWELHVLDRSDYIDMGRQYYSDPRFAAEMRVLRRRSTKLYRGYHRLTNSPLLRLYTRALLTINETALACGPGATFRVLVDSFADSHGIDEVETVSMMMATAGLERITGVERVRDSDEIALVQAADLVGFSLFRMQMFRRGYMNEDKAMGDILGNERNGASVTTANIPHRIRRRYPEWERIALTLHYALARAHVVEYDAEFAQRNLISVEDFKARALEGREVGVSVLTEAALSTMAKTPD